MKPPESGETREGDSIKIEDRRLFTPDGQLREGMTERTRPAREKKVPAPGPGGESAQRPATQRGMLALIEFLFGTAAVHMGAGPEGALGPVDLRTARQVTEMLEILRQRTQGRLSEDEERYLEERLYELQMLFMEKSRPPGR